MILSWFTEFSKIQENCTPLLCVSLRVTINIILKSKGLFTPSEGESKSKYFLWCLNFFFDLKHYHPQCRGRHPPAQCMLGYTHPWGDTPLSSASWDTHLLGRHPPRADTPRQTPSGQTPPGQTCPSSAATTVDGMHATGMPSCLICDLFGFHIHIHIRFFLGVNPLTQTLASPQL